MTADFSTPKAWRGLPRPIETSADMLAETQTPALQSELRKTLRAIFTPAEFDAVRNRAAEIALGITA